MDQRLVNDFQWDVTAASTERALSVLVLCWMWPLVCVCVCVCTCVTLPTCWSGLAQSVIQVRPTGSGLMRIGSALSESQPDVAGVCGTGREKEHETKTLALQLEKQPEMQTNPQKKPKKTRTHNLSRHNDKAHCSGFLWGAVGHRYTNHSFRRSGPHSPFLLVYRKLFVCVFFFSALRLYSSSKQSSCPWQTCFKVTLIDPRLFKLW